MNRIVDGLTVRERGQLLDVHGLSGVTIGFFTDRFVNKPRQSKKLLEYLDVLQAYEEVMKEKRGTKWGSLKRTAIILTKKYEWAYSPDSYTVRGYLNKAQKLWRVTPVDSGDDT